MADVIAAGRGFVPRLGVWAKESVAQSRSNIVREVVANLIRWFTNSGAKLMKLMIRELFLEHKYACGAASH